MITLTKEWLLKTIAELEEERDATPGAVNEDAAMALAAMKLALASLEAEPLCVIDQANLDYLNAGSDADVWPASRTEMGDVLLYRSAPPAPVSVPEWTNEQCLEFLSIAFRHAEIKGDLELDDIRLGVKMANGSRAAMLQGAEPVTTAYKLPFEQWLSQQTGTIDVECGCVMTEVFFHWLRVAYEAGNSPVIPDGWVAVPVEPTKEMINSAMRDNETGEVAEIYELMLAAAPQQEVK
ncbi:TPA: hypothetical protein ACT92I_000786 [Enterobacter hormaechei subsp. xiangfangensis]